MLIDKCDHRRFVPSITTLSFLIFFLHKQLRPRLRIPIAQIMNPFSNIIAHKAQSQLQIFNVALKSKIKSQIEFYERIDSKTIGLVTETTVYHWYTESDASEPQKVFERNTSLQGAQIVSYKVDSEDKWMVLIGISQKSGLVVGEMQIYSRDSSVSQTIGAYAGAFAEIQLQGAPSKTKLFTFATRNAAGAKVPH